MQKILKHLTSELSKNSQVKDPKAMAVAILQKHKILDSSLKLTAYGKKRNALTPAKRRQTMPSVLKRKA